MKIFRSLLRYQYRMYVKSNKFIMPFLTWIIFLYVLYHQCGLEFVSSILISMSFLFPIMTWISITYLENIDPVAEQILLLKVNNRNTYYNSKNVFVFLVGIIFSFVGAIYPIMQNGLNGFSIFTRQLTIWDLLCALILHIVAALLGELLGVLFQPRCMKNRKDAIVFIALIAVISIAKTGINHTFLFAKYITWLFPPLCNITSLFSNCDYFAPVSIVKAILFAGIYSIILLMVSNQILKRKLF